MQIRDWRLLSLSVKKDFLITSLLIFFHPRENISWKGFVARRERRSLEFILATHFAVDLFNKSDLDARRKCEIPRRLRIVIRRTDFN